MALFEVHFKWMIGGEDSVIVRADNKQQANEVFETQFGEQFDLEEVIPDGLQIELLPTLTKPISAIQTFRKGQEDDFEILAE